LNENERGSSSSIEKPCSRQARCSENIRSRSGSSSGSVDDLQHDDAPAESQRGLDRVGDALLGARPHDEPVDDDLDRVLLLLLQGGRLGQRVTTPSTRARA
jgi:hypothetical protein